MHRLILGLFLVSSLSVSTEAWYYRMYQKRLVPVDETAQKEPLGNVVLGDAVYYNQERIDKLRADVKALKIELLRQKKEQKRLEDALIRFRNYYFRNI